MSALEVAARHARTRARLAARAQREAKRAWALVDSAAISQSWSTLMPAVYGAIVTGQREAAASADAYVTAAGAGQTAAGRVNADAFAGIASDGRNLLSLLALPAIITKTAIGQGYPTGRAMAAGSAMLQLAARTQVADAGRVADQVSMVARHQTGYTRMVVGATCSRCIILAGRWYRWDAGFKRHPKCDCVGVPAAESADELRTNPKTTFASMSVAEQDKIFTKAGAQAIRDGADMARVVNARRGMQAAADGRLYTTEAAGRRPRLMPETIYTEARDRDDAIRLLRLHGFIL